MAVDAALEPALTEGPSDPEDVAGRIAAACHDPAAGVWDALDQRMGAAVLSAVADVRERHEELLVECGLGGDPPPDGASRRTVLVTYRQGLTSDVLPMLASIMEHHKPTSLAAGIFARAFASALEGARELPEATMARWGEGALDRHITDTMPRRARKALGRVFSTARRADRKRPVRVRVLALRHLGHHIVPIFDRAASDAVRSWAEWAGRLERALATWAEAALPVLAGADIAGLPRPGSGTDVEPPEDRAWIALHDAAQALDQALTALCDGQPHGGIRRWSEGAVARARGALESDVRAAGSFVFRAEAPVLGAHPLPELDRTRSALGAWDQQVAARIELYRSLLAVLVGGAAVRERSAARLEAIGLEPLGTLLRCADDLSDLAGRTRSRSMSDAPGAFDDLQEEGDRLVAEALATFPDLDRVSWELESLVGETVDALQGIVRHTPDLLVLHRLETRIPTNLRGAETREIPFQELARESLDALRIERIRAVTLGFGPTMLPVRANISELPDVIQFAFDASRKELVAETPDGRAAARAAMLATEALERSTGVLRHAPEQVRMAAEAAERQIAMELAEGGAALLERVGAGRVQSQFLRARSRLGDVLLRFDRSLGPTLGRGRRRARLVSLRTGRSVRRMSRRVRALLGDDGHGPAAQSARTVRAFARADSGPGHVPLVYQRLFSLDPVTDPAFLVGRSTELADVSQRWRRWREEDEVPVVLRGYPGSGVTSFLRVAMDTLVEDGASVVRLDVEKRIGSELELATRLGTLLDLPAAATLGAFAENVLGTPRDAGLPEVVVLDGLEHLYLRAPGGTDLLERFLTFMSETEPRIFWLAGVSQPAWKLIAKAEPTAVSQVDDFELRALPVERLKETILQRHRRSGLRLRFEEPREGRALLKRRLRRLRGTDAHQSVLRDDFFEQLHRVSLGNLKLALFHWLLAADFERAEGEVLMQPFRKPDFGVLDALDPTHNFTLKSLLEHRTLTLAEHAAIFRVTLQESYQTFESLQGRRLIEPVDGSASWEMEDSEINRATRYRIRPLLVGAITGHLRTLNIVH